MHTEAQGYRDASFSERVFAYHLWLVLQYPKRRVRTVALWLMDAPPRELLGEIERGDVRVRTHPIVLPRVPAEVLLDDPACVCFAAGADPGTLGVKGLCARVASVLRASNASWNRRHMAVVAAATQGRYNEMVEAMAHENLDPVIIEDLIHIGEDRGHAAGHAAGQREALRQIIAVRGLVLTEAQRLHLERCSDHAKLSDWLARALRDEDPAAWLG